MDNIENPLTATVKGWLDDLPQERSSLLPLLWRVVEKAGWLSPDAIGAVADVLGLPYAEVYGVASFYALFPMAAPEGVSVHVCTDIMCRLAGADGLRQAIEGDLARQARIEAAPCLGLCDRAPAVLVDRQWVAPASPETVAVRVKEAGHE